jgi:hypothetical protein
MHARPEVRDILIAAKMKKWAMIGHHPFNYPGRLPSRARRNFSRLLARYPEIARRLGLNLLSVYPSP